MIPTLPKKELGEILKQIYEDLPQPAIRNIGQALGTIFDLSNTILLPIKLLNERCKLIFSNNLKLFGEKLAEKQSDDISEVQPEIGLPLLDKLLISEEPLRTNLFLNLLLSSSSHKDKNTAHPRFISIIDNLSQDEAMIMVYLSEVNEKEEGIIPFLDFILHFDEAGKFKLLPEKTLIDEVVQLSFPENIGAYIDNMTSLGLIKKGDGSYSDDTYKSLNKFKKEFIASVSKDLNLKSHNVKLKDEKDFYQISDLGKMFIEGCKIDTVREEIFNK